MLKIGEFSRLAQVSVKTLRYYSDLGLLRPAYVDRYNGYRYYALDQLPRLNRILALKELGFSLTQIERLLRDDLPAGELQRLMQLKHAELANQVAQEQARLARVAARLRQIEEEGRLPHYEVLIKRVEPQRVVGIRDAVGSFADLYELFAELNAFLRARGTVPEAAPLALYYDAEYSEQNADVEAAIPIGGRLRGSGRVVVHELPGSPAAASVVHTGRYDGLGLAYGALLGWAQANGYRTVGPNREVYLQGPEASGDTRRCVTEIFFPVQVAGARSNKEQARMEPKILTKPAFTVVGVPFRGLTTSGPFEDGVNNNEIGKAWDQLNSRSSELKDVSGPAIGLCFGMPNPDDPWYIAGMEVRGDGPVPAGMMRRDVPEQKYAVFECTLPTLSETYRYIAEEWQPRSGYQHAGTPDFELYGEEWDMADQKNSKMYVYWPVK